jgi:hypothetical protein
VRRFTSDGKDFEAMNPRIAELAREAGATGWHPDHPNTAPDWLSRRLVLEGVATISEVEAMPIEEQADWWETILVAADVQAWQHAQARPDG